MPWKTKAALLQHQGKHMNSATMCPPSLMPDLPGRKCATHSTGRMELDNLIILLQPKRQQMRYQQASIDVPHYKRCCCRGLSAALEVMDLRSGPDGSHPPSSCLKPSAVRKRFLELSVLVHPDKNPAIQAKEVVPNFALSPSLYHPSLSLRPGRYMPIELCHITLIA